MPFKIESEFKKKWLLALRSDNYRQIKSHLGDGSNGRCCLGVGADIAGVYSYIPDTSFNGRPSSSERVHRLYRDRELQISPGHEIKDEFPSTDMLVRMGGLNSEAASTLANMNDDGDTFLFIADFIEDNF
jgi:hypothetical protein